MSDRFNPNNSYTNNRLSENNSEMSALNSMESVHQRKKAAFDELFRYTYNNLKETSLESKADKQP